MRRTEAVDAALWAEVAEWLASPDLVSAALAARSGEATAEGRQALADLRDWRARYDALPAREADALHLCDRGLLSPQARDARLGEIARTRAMLARQIEAASRLAEGAEQAAREAMALETAIELLRGKAERATSAGRREIVRGLVAALQLDLEGRLVGEAQMGMAVRAISVLAA